MRENLQSDAVVYREGDSHVAQCLNVDVSSLGNSAEEALAGLREALDLHSENAPPALRISSLFRK